MTKHNITPQDDAAQPMTAQHLASWIDYIARQFAEVQAKRQAAQTVEDHASLADREVRYAGYLSRAGVKL